MLPANYQPAADLLAGRVILVTGAGQGIGRTLALACAQHGATVVLLGRGVKKLEAVYDEIELAGYPKPAAVPLDLEKATDADFERVVAAIADQLGRLDGIVHSAAAFLGLFPLEQEGLDYWLKALRVNVAAPAALTRAAMPLLKASPDASVIYVSETHGHTATAYWGGFSVSKHAGAFWAQIAANEWDNLPNFRINTLIPGPVQSPQRTKTHPGEEKASLPATDTLMPAFLYLLGPDSKGQSGQTIDCVALRTANA